MSTQYGRAIRIVREARGIRSSDLARAAELSNPYISLVEKGERIPSMEVLGRIASALKVPLDALLVVAQPTAGSLSTSDTRAQKVADSIRLLMDAENALMNRLDMDGEKGSDKEG